MRKSRHVGSGRTSARVWALLAPLAVLVPIVLAAPALAHLERPSYWPDPGPDTSVSPPAGGEVPKARSFASAVTGKGPGKVRVVCKGAGGELSLRALARSLRKVERKGFRLRPSQPKIEMTKKQIRKLKAANRALAKQCDYHAIQPAVNDSGNNDRIVIMPGRYTEPASRRQPTNDPRCNPSLLQQDQSGALTPSYEYQATCPNDQNLVYVQGRAIKGDPLPVPDPDRHGIPEQELGECVRCNLQIEGSGAMPEDVIIDGGKGYENPAQPTAQPTDYAKHVVMRTDRSDGFVGRNFLLRGALEHGFYTEETDGILLDRVKFYWGADYGHLSFTTDHNVVKNCEAIGSGDAGVYPGAAPQTGEFRDETFYPFERLNTVVKKCDLHGNTLAYSGSMGNSVRVTANHIYGNTLGIASDTLSAPGHPGFPADGMLIDRNYIYSNNLNLFTPDPPFEPYIGIPLGTGVIWAGLNGGELRENWIFDNWRHGTVLLAVPDALGGEPEGNVDRTIHCTLTAISSTSCGNSYHDNHLGQVPPDFKFPPEAAMTMFGNKTPPGAARCSRTASTSGGTSSPGTTATAGSTTSALTEPPRASPAPARESLPTCSRATVARASAIGDVIKEAVLLDCSMWSRGETAEDRPLCYWFQMPAKPGTAAARADQRKWDAAAADYAKSPEAQALSERLDAIGETAFANRP